MTVPDPRRAPSQFVRRILDLPEPYRSRFVAWLADSCGLAGLRDAPDEKLALAESLLRAAERAFGKGGGTTALLGGTRLLYLAKAADDAPTPRPPAALRWDVLEQAIYGEPGLEVLHTRPLVQGLTLAQARDCVLMLSDWPDEGRA